MKFAAFALVASYCLVVVTAVEENEDVKCEFSQVLNLKNIFQKFRDDIKNCKGDIDERTQKLINSLDEMMEIGNKISDIYETNCEGGEHIGVICKTKISVEIINFVAKAVEVGKQIESMRKLPGDVNECVLNAIHDIGNDLTASIAKIKACRSNSF